MAETSLIEEQNKIKNLEFSKEVKKILIFSGKRKSGKDFITDELYKRLGGDKSVIIKLSGPIKTHWAKSKNLNTTKLFSDGEYKEQYRLEMAKWGEKIRNENYGYFCRAAIEMYNTNKSIWIISDARRKTDLKWFKETYGEKCKIIRIECSEEIRKSRGWIFCKGIDDCETECDLDDVNNWDLKVNNDNEDVELILNRILNVL
ncbi:PREDICTED: phosphomevalonate kinase isoform X1 [Ceratosolen solmsi marchali]|uniref:Phosphomevalonate kinase n=1 Tax=Ceratosolen solmsi marchali TaxID=326594 RepID=A0AAJ6YMC5_9HYME|nr:PREDICTED: phosphomevalonate kinase isoform X1 [Ceratosolen solmsi marchali]